MESTTKITNAEATPTTWFDTYVESYQKNVDQVITIFTYQPIDNISKLQISKKYNFFPEFTRLTFNNIQIPKFFSNEEVTITLIKASNILDGHSPDSLPTSSFEIIVNYWKDNSNLIIPPSSITSISSDYKKSNSISWTQSSNTSPSYYIFNNLLDKYIFRSLWFNSYLLNLTRDYVVSQMKWNVSVVTWNLSSIELPDLSTLFHSGSWSNSDIFAIGVQECKVLKINKWIENIRTLSEYYGFVQVAEENLFQMFEIVFVKKELKPLIDSIETAKKGMGFANCFGNKGAMLISLRLLGFVFVFVNCHLSPKVFKTWERNKMAKNFVDSIRWNTNRNIPFDVYGDYVFWFGDLNYRVDFPFSDTINILKTGNWKTLLDKDQLRKQISTNNIFSHFSEKEIDFSPTYRRTQVSGDLNIKTRHSNSLFTPSAINTNIFKNDYDCLFNNKDNQTPSWCDRVLWKTNRFFEILDYKSLKNIQYSDHLPVQCSYSIYLTLPIWKNMNTIDKNEDIKGSWNYKNVQWQYNIAQREQLKYPFMFKIEVYYFIYDQPVVTYSKSYTSEKEWPYDGSKKEFFRVKFNDFEFPLPPKIIFDYPQTKSFNMFFIVKLVSGKEEEEEVGFSKYSLENTEKNMNLLNHRESWTLHYLLRDYGVLSFDAFYQYKELNE